LTERLSVPSNKLRAKRWKWFYWRKFCYIN
jgi:hypothetical protein